MNKCFKLALFGLSTLQLVACASQGDSEKLVIGKISQAELFNTYTGFSSSYGSFELSAEEIDQVKSWPADIAIDVYFGTWCHDSQREVPKLLKLLSYNPEVAVNLVALDHQKTDPQGLAVSRNVKYTPTIIIRQGNEEIGRIIERPANSLTSDINGFVLAPN